MLALAADENLNRAILRGLLAAEPALDIVRIQDVGLAGAEDPVVLEWAANEGRVVVTHDAASMPRFASERVSAGLSMSGLCVVRRGLQLSRVIQDLRLIGVCSDGGDWAGAIRYLPL